MNPQDAVKEVERCAGALSKALNAAAAAGQTVDIEVVKRARSGRRADLREVLVHHHDRQAGIKPEELHSANND